MEEGRGTQENNAQGFLSWFFSELGRDFNPLLDFGYREKSLIIQPPNIYTLI